MLIRIMISLNFVSINVEIKLLVVLVRVDSSTQRRLLSLMLICIVKGIFFPRENRGSTLMLVLLVMSQLRIRRH